MCSIEAHKYRLNNSDLGRRFSNWIIPRTASATRALLRLIPCHRAYCRPSLWRDFEHSRLPWIDGRWVQDLRTYSPRYIWPAITSNSGFMGSSFSPQSELAQFFLGFAQGYPVAARCNCDCIMCVAQGIRGTCWPGVILSFLPDLNSRSLCFVLLGRGSLVWHL